MEVKIKNLKGKDTTSSVKLNKAVFGVEPNEHVVYLDVKQYLANQRQGTHKVKERGEVVGSTRKIKKQKGTGTARAGSIKNPLFKGGGRVFGPRPRDYRFKLNVKTKRLARKSALSQQLKDNNIMAFNSSEFKESKTKAMFTFLKDLKIDDKKVLIVLEEQNKNVILSSQNLQNVKVLKASDLNTYNILRYNKLLIDSKAFSKIEETLKDN